MMDWDDIVWRLRKLRDEMLRDATVGTIDITSEKRARAGQITALLNQAILLLEVTPAPTDTVQETSLDALAIRVADMVAARLAASLRGEAS
jgi:hypothetical protein